MLQETYASNLDESADQFISVIVSGALRLERLLKDLLTYSQAGSTLGPATEVDSAAVMKEVLLNLQVTIDENGARVHWHDLPLVRADQIGLVQLFQNLIGNAIKYRSSMPPCIEVWAERGEKEWLFAVRDNGI